MPARLRRYVDALDIDALLLLAAALTAVLGALVFMAVAGAVTDGDTQQIDEAIVRWFRDPGTPAVPRGPAWVREAAIDVTALGSNIVLTLIVLAALGFLWMHNQHRLFLMLVAAVIGGNIMNSLFKVFFARPRPDIVPHLREVVTYSFPSGHAALSATVYLTMGILLFEVVRAPRARIYCLCIAMLTTALVGLSRVYLGVHYPSDVLAGWAVGITWAALCWLGLQYTARRHPR